MKNAQFSSSVVSWSSEKSEKLGLAEHLYGYCGVGGGIGGVYGGGGVGVAPGDGADGVVALEAGHLALQQRRVAPHQPARVHTHRHRRAWSLL